MKLEENEVEKSLKQKKSFKVINNKDLKPNKKEVNTPNRYQREKYIYKFEQRFQSIFMLFMPCSQGKAEDPPERPIQLHVFLHAQFGSNSVLIQTVIKFSKQRTTLRPTDHGGNNQPNKT